MASKAKPLNPALWRTCRVLGSPVRLTLLQAILQTPGLNVSGLAANLPVGISAVSQELRRLQSRGLLRRSCHGPAVVYLPVPDPREPMAAPLLSALKAMLVGKDGDLAHLAVLAQGLGHEKRIELVRTLLVQGPGTAKELATIIRTSLANLSKHLRILSAGGWLRKSGRKYALQPASSPLMSTLLGLI